MCLTGTGTTFVLTSGGAVAAIKEIAGFHEELEEIERNLLSDAIGDHQKYCPGERVQHEPLEITIEFDPDDPQALGVIDTGTLTFQPQGAQTVGATLAGTGFMRRRGFEGLQNNEIVDGTVEWRFDGETGPVYTPGSGP